MISALLGALTLGSVFVVNAWDLPLTIAVTIAALFYGGLLRSLRTAILLALAGAMTLAVGYAIFLPFHANFYSVVEGVARAEAGSALRQFLTMWGIFFVIVGVVVGYRAYRALRAPRRAERAIPFILLLIVGGFVGLAAIRVERLNLDSASTGQVFGAFAVIAIIVSLAAIAARPLAATRYRSAQLRCWQSWLASSAPSEPSAAVAIGFATSAAMFAVARWQSPSRFFPWAFIAVGCLTIASTEFVYVVDDLQNGAWQRMNTVFKFYLQAWLLIATGSAILLARLVASVSLPSVGNQQQFGIVANKAGAFDEEVSPVRAKARPVVTMLAESACWLSSSASSTPSSRRRSGSARTCPPLPVV